MHRLAAAVLSREGQRSPLRPGVPRLGPKQPEPLLGPSDPPPFRVLNARGRAPMLLTCDHASWSVPASLGRLGLGERDLRRHIGWDPGAADLTRQLAEQFDAPAILSGYSRLVIDCNRAPGTAESIPAMSDGTQVPGNSALSPADIERRELALFRPYHSAVSRMLSAIRNGTGRRPAYVAVHSFTPFLDGFDRPWHVGVLWDRDTPLAQPLIGELRRVPGLKVGDNQPYSAKSEFDYSRMHHASRAGLPYVLLEVRSDLLTDRPGVDSYASLIATALRTALSTLGQHWQDRP